MTAAAPTFDLVAVPSALVDRRALSQAWYDALHLAERKPVPPVGGLRSIGAGRVAALRPSGDCPSQPAASAPNRARLMRAAPHAAAPSLSGRIGERRAVPSRLARRIVAEVRREPARASFTLRTAFGRVHLCVRREHGVLRLVALCSPGARAAVDRALAHARFALAAAGVRVA